MKRILFLALACALSVESAWAFPTNAVLDSFTGCTDTTEPPNANWTLMQIFGSTTATECKTSTATSGTAGTYSGSYWNPTTFNQNQEAYVTLGSQFGGSALAGIGLRMRDIGAGTTDGYLFQLDNGGNTLQITKITNGSSALLGTGVSISPAAGDKFGGTAIGTQICSWYKTAAGSWTQQECVTDSTYTGSGRIAMSVSDSQNQSLDDFGGGNLRSAPVPPILLSWLLNPFTALWNLLEVTNAYAR